VCFSVIGPPSRCSNIPLLKVNLYLNQLAVLMAPFQAVSMEDAQMQRETRVEAEGRPDRGRMGTASRLEHIDCTVPPTVGLTGYLPQIRSKWDKSQH
jgi:hypothetical protein